MAQHDKNKQKGFRMDPEMKAASYMAGTPAFKLEKIPEDATGIRKLIKSEKGREAVENMGYDPASAKPLAMKPAYAMGNLDNLRNEKGVITPSAMKADPKAGGPYGLGKKPDPAMKADPGGFYTNFKVETPEYLKSAGYGYNPDQTYTFSYKDKDNKIIKTDSPLSQEEYDAGGYTLSSASYRPVQNKNVDIGTDTKGYPRLKPVTSKLPSSDMSQEEANRRNNPYISQFTRFGNKDGNLSQQYTRNRVSRDYGTRIKYDKDGNPFIGFKGKGADSVFSTRPGISGPSNVMTNFKTFTFENRNDLPTYNFTRSFRSVGDPITPRNPNYNVSVLGAKYSFKDKRDQRLLRQSVGPGMFNILKDFTFTNRKSGETFPIFKSKK